MRTARGILHQSASLVSGALEWLAVGLLAALVALVLANALGRYLFTMPLPWTEEIVLILLVWVAAVGVVLAGLRQSLICCDMLTYKMNPKIARLSSAACSVIGVGVMGYFSWLTVQYLRLFGGDLSPVLRLPKFLAIAGLLFATSGLALVMLKAAARLRRP